MKVGFSNGVFDLLHEGHRYFLTACTEGCDYLIVAVNSDASVKRLKGDSRPIEPLDVRMTAVGEFANAVIPFEGLEDGLIMAIRPNVIFKGYDHSPNQTHWAARTPGWKNLAHGVWTCPVIHVGHLPGFSTTLAAEAK